MDYVRRIILETSIVTTYRNQPLDDSMTEMMRLFNELNSIGNNFNQAVKKLHTLNQIAEFRGWLNTYETDKNNILKKVEETKIHIEKVARYSYSN